MLSVVAHADAEGKDICSLLSALASHTEERDSDSEPLDLTKFSAETRVRI